MIQEKNLTFAISIVKLYKLLADFLNKMNIALKETDYLSDTEFNLSILTQKSWLRHL